MVSKINIFNSIYVVSYQKCGSSILFEIMNYIASVYNYKYITYLDLKNDNKKNIKINDFQKQLNGIPCIYIHRDPKNNIFDCNNIFNDDNILKLIFVRHPLDRLISQYYSYKYTHTTHAHWIDNKIKKYNEEQFIIKRRNNMKNISLNNYIEQTFLKHNIWHDFVLKYKSFKNTLVLPYELMVHRIDIFCEKIFHFFKLENQELNKKIYEHVKHFFVMDDIDNTQKIVNENLKTHIRNPKQYNEFESKLSQETINKYKNHDFVKYYENLRNIYNIKNIIKN